MHADHTTMHIGHARMSTKIYDWSLFVSMLGTGFARWWPGHLSPYHTSLTNPAKRFEFIIKRRESGCPQLSQAPDASESLAIQMHSVIVYPERLRW